MADQNLSCELCEAARFTHWYAADDICWVADCEACNVPMVVWNKHQIEPSAADRDHMVRVLTDAADGRFGPDGWSLDGDMRTIPDHFHMHARDPDWFSERFRRPISRYSGVGTERVERR